MVLGHRSLIRKQACLFAAVVQLHASTGWAQAGAYQIIVHPSNPISEIDSETLQRIFLKKVTQWPHGEMIRPVDLPQRSPTRQRFSREVLGKHVYLVRSYWNQRIFSGRAVPPPEKQSGEVLEYVLRHRGAIGYLPAGMDPNGAKVIRIAGTTTRMR